MMKRIKVLVLMGGKSPEYKISLITGKEIVKNLDRKKYEVFPVVISRDGQEWRLISVSNLLKLDISLNADRKEKDLVFTPAGKRIQNIKRIGKEIDLVFIAMHGPYGEDGTIQGMLELSGIPYTGSGVLASALGMDKIMFRKILLNEGIAVPRFVVIEKGKNFNGKELDRIHSKLGEPPYFIKPYNQGSSVGNSIVRKRKELPEALELAFKYSDKALVDEYVKGIEVTCGIIGNDNPQALPLVEIVPQKGKFFDYESKYTESGADEIVPARISSQLSKKVQRIAIDVYKAIGAKGFSRVDFILKEDEYPIVLEINTIPGLTPVSLFPKAAKAAGLSYSSLLDKIISYALK